MRGVVTLAAVVRAPGGHSATGGPGPHRHGGHRGHAAAARASRCRGWPAASGCAGPTRARTPCRRPPSCRPPCAPGCALSTSAPTRSTSRRWTRCAAGSEQRVNIVWERLGSTDSTQETPSEAYRRVRLQMLRRRARRGAPHPRRRGGRPRGARAGDGRSSTSRSRCSTGSKRADEAAAGRPLLPPEPAGGACEHLRQAPTHVRPADAAGLPGLRARRHDAGAPADVPGLRQRRLLRLLGRQARRPALRTRPATP